MTGNAVRVEETNWDLKDTKEEDEHGALITSSPLAVTESNQQRPNDSIPFTSPVTQETEEGKTGWLKKFFRPHHGLIFVMLSNFAYATNIVIVKALEGQTSSFQIAFVRQLSIFIYSSPLLIFFKLYVRPTLREVFWL